MGVRGLMTYLLANRDQCSELVDLIEVARQRGGIEILTDFYSFEHFALKHFWSGLCRLRQNKYLPILGGEYHSQDKFFSKLIRDLQAVGIRLVFFVDGAKGSSKKQVDQKLPIWRSRHQQDLERMEKYMNVCRGVINMEDMQNEEFVRPVLLEVGLYATLAECGCEIVHCIAGEADDLIAKAFFEREKAFCVLSNDTDFCIFPDCRLILLEVFDLDGYLGLGLPEDQPRRTEKLMCGLFATQRLMQHLGLSSHSQLVDMSIISGNDYTGHLVRQFHSRIGLGGRRTIPMLVDWLHQHGGVEAHPFLSAKLRENPQFQQAVQISRDFYAHPENAVAKEEQEEKGFVANLIEINVKNGTYPPSFASIQRHFYWHRFLMEEMGPGWPCIEVELMPFRRIIYNMLLPPRNNMVYEHGRTPRQPMEVIQVPGIEGLGLPAVHKVQTHQIHWNLKTFHHAMCILDSANPDQSHPWIERYGRKTGFRIYVLRYWLKLNWRRNLGVIEAEFLALVATVMGNIDPDHCQQICLRPTPRCVTLGNWFQDIYRHAYLFLGKILHIHSELPLPHEVFSGAVWTAFFTCSNSEAWDASAHTVPVTLLQETESKMFAIIKEKRHMLRYIVEDIPGFDNRF